MIIRDNFCKFFNKTYVVTPHLNRLDINKNSVMYLTYYNVRKFWMYYISQFCAWNDTVQVNQPKLVTS